MKKVCFTTTAEIYELLQDEAMRQRKDIREVLIQPFLNSLSGRSVYMGRYERWKGFWDENNTTTQRIEE